MPLRLTFKKLNQEILEQYMDFTFKGLFDLCGYPVKGSTEKGKGIEKQKFSVDIDFFNRQHTIGVSLDPIPYQSNLMEQSIEIDKDLLLQILKEIPNDNIILSIKDNCPLIISLPKEQINIFVSPNKEDDEE